MTFTVTGSTSLAAGFILGIRTETAAGDVNKACRIQCKGSNEMLGCVKGFKTTHSESRPLVPWTIQEFPSMIHRLASAPGWTPSSRSMFTQQSLPIAPPHIHYESWGRDAPGTSIDAKQWRFRRPNGKQVKGPLVSSLHPFTQRRVGLTWDRMTCLWDPFPAQAQTRKRASTKHRQSLPRGGLPLNIT